MGSSIAAATPLSQPVDANLVRLIKAPFTPNEDMIVGDLTFADFDGATSIACPLVDAQVGIDPVTGQQRLTVKEPLGGWRFVTTGVTNLPQSIYGYALVTAASAALIAVQTLPAPIALTETGQEINLGTVSFDIVLQPME